ncbi:hypothetical protein C942_04306 [Photobacterium marinum]|uniref:Uncharacterized protein n=1 Tax=Photobacterium marinum TaxID=1056511 RepID=L8JEB3_9GAMM|nr:hypothetical protein C942_04306 [Photobacterium marinum]
MAEVYIPYQFCEKTESAQIHDNVTGTFIEHPTNRSPVRGRI